MNIIVYYCFKSIFYKKQHNIDKDEINLERLIYISISI